jgi:hypothetical protein
MSVAQPDWNVAGTAAFEREVRQYSERVSVVIAKYQVATTLPVPASQ